LAEFRYYKRLAHPADTQLAAICAMRRPLGHLATASSTRDFSDMVPFAGRDLIIGQGHARLRERGYFAGDDEVAH
jgi:hypothetical protein